jgi:hypothetical protein
MKRTCAIVLMLTSTFAVAAGARGQQAGRGDPDVWRTFVRNLLIGSVVKVRIEGGKRLTAVLFVVDDEGITIKPRTRVPEPARHVRFDRLEDIEVEHDGASYKKAAGIGAAAGAGLLLMLLAGTFQ